MAMELVLMEASMNKHFSFILLTVLSVLLAGCLRTCSISPDTSDLLYFSNDILERIHCQEKRFMLLELKTLIEPDEALVNGTFALVIRDDEATHWVVYDPFNLCVSSVSSEISPWVLIDPRKNDFQRRIPLLGHTSGIHQLMQNPSNRVLSVIGSTNVVDTQQVYNEIDGCHVVLIPGKTKFQVFADTNNSQVAYAYRDALLGGHARPSITRCIAENDDFHKLLIQYQAYRERMQARSWMDSSCE
jgi:hypothetical protein